MRWIRWAGMFAMTFGAVAGCDAPAEIRPGDIRTYAIPKAPADTEEASAPSGSEAGTSAAPEEAN